jgi:competence protein ComEA
VSHVVSWPQAIGLSGTDERPPAQIGTVFLAVVFIAAALGFAARPDPVVPALFVHLGGVDTPGWVAAADVNEALAGTEARFLVGEPQDGDPIEVFGPYAIVQHPDTPVAYRAMGGKLSLNHATQAELEALPHIGPTLAKRILRARPFSRVEQLDDVKGIGPATLAKLLPFVKP